MSEPTTRAGRALLEPSCCDLACYEDEGCACDGCRPKEPQAALLAAARAEDHSPTPRFGTDFVDCRCGWKPERRGVLVWWAHLLAALRAAIEEADRG